MLRALCRESTGVRITIDGRPQGYDDTGGDGFPLVLLHGFGCDRTVWDEVVSHLGGFRIIRPDLRGCGETPPGDGPALMDTLAGDVAALLDALRIERAALVGHSLGGYATLAFFRMYAERVAGLALVASHALADSPERAAAREAIAAATERDGSMEAIFADYAPRLFASQVYEERPQLVEDVRAMMARQHPRGAVELLRGMKERVDAEDLYEDVRVPVLVLAGGRDVLVPPAWSQRAADGIAGAVQVTLDDVGHMVPSEAPERTAAAIDAFARKVLAEQPPGPGMVPGQGTAHERAS